MRVKNPSVLTSWLPQVKDPINDFLSRYVCALTTVEGNSPPEAWASAVTVVWKDQPLLLTAKHVIDQLDGRQLLLEVPDRFEPIVVCPDLLAANSTADAVAIRLPPQSVHWGIQFVILDLEHEPALDKADIEIFVAMGFPTRETARAAGEAQLALSSVNYWSLEHRDAYRLLKLSPSDCLAIKYDRKRSFQHGIPRAMKKPHGMSGGALWRLWGPQTEVPSLRRHGLAGVLTEYRDFATKCMLSARLGVLEDLAKQLIEG